MLTGADILNGVDVEGGFLNVANQYLNRRKLSSASTANRLMNATAWLRGIDPSLRIDVLADIVYFPEKRAPVRVGDERDPLKISR